MVGRRTAAILLAMLLAVALSAAAQAQQAPPVPPYTFFGATPLLDGAPAPEGTVVQAIDENGEPLAAGAVTGGFWVVDVPGGTRAASVRFQVEGFPPSDPFPLLAGELTEVSLSFVTPTEEPPPDDGEEPDDGNDEPEPPVTLPNGGTGGLADPSSPWFWVLVGAGLSAIAAAISIRQARQHTPVPISEAEEEAAYRRPPLAPPPPPLLLGLPRRVGGVRIPLGVPRRVGHVQLSLPPDGGSPTRSSPDVPSSATEE